MNETTIGIISDTHMPNRWLSLPEAVRHVFADVDLIFHAGDVGELWVTDQLSAIAPVIAVHGNDESDAAEAAFPYFQVVSVAGRRICLMHSHYQDYEQEMASRKGDSWHPKLARLAEIARTQGADLLIYGHTHIAMNVVYDGVRLINPGAIASGNTYSRMTVQSVAKLTLARDSEPIIEHYDLKQPQTPFAMPYDIEDGFRAAYAHFSEVFFTPDLLAKFFEVWGVMPMPQKVQLLEATRPVLYECWQQKKDSLSLDEVKALVSDYPDLVALLNHDD